MAVIISYLATASALPTVLKEYGVKIFHPVSDSGRRLRLVNYKFEPFLGDIRNPNAAWTN